MQQKMNEAQPLTTLLQQHDPREASIDRVVRIARHLFDVRIVAVNLLDEGRLLVKAGAGLPTGHLPRPGTFCDQTLRLGERLVVPDARLDPRFADLPQVAGPPGLRSYVGTPLAAPNGQLLGSLCIIDDHPRTFNPTQMELIDDLARWVEDELTTTQELLQAGELQRRLHPRRAPVAPGYSVVGRNFPAREVGGDFYDWYDAGGQLQVVLGDVMGKGIGAAIIAAGVRSVLRGASRFNDLAEAVTRSGYSMEDDLEETGRFVTMFCVRIDRDSGTATFVDAGHGLAVVFDGSGGFRRLLTGGFPMGTIPACTWVAGTTVLSPGETMVVVSDGLLDFFDNPRDALDAASRLNRTATSAQDFLDGIADAVEPYRLSDDVTAVIVRRDSLP